MANTISVKEGARVLARVTVQPDGAAIDGTPELVLSDGSLATFQAGANPGEFEILTLDASGGDEGLTVNWGTFSATGTITIEDVAPPAPEATGITLDLSEAGAGENPTPGEPQA